MTASLPIARVLSVWLILAIAMTANGAFRELALKRAIAPAAADIVSAALGVAIILGITRPGFRPLAANSTAQLTVVCAMLVVLTVGFELVVGRLVDHKSWSDLFGNYAIWRGKLWPIVLVVLALTPFIWGRWRRA